MMATAPHEMCMKILVVTKDNMPAVNMSDETRRESNTMGNVTTIATTIVTTLATTIVMMIVTTIATTTENTTARDAPHDGTCHENNFARRRERQLEQKKGEITYALNAQGRVARGLTIDTRKWC